MSGKRHPRLLLSKAESDFKSLRNMLDPQQHDDDVFGFHAQQAIEKSLKAWIAHLGLRFDFTHDILRLIGQLRAHGADVVQFEHLEDFTIYAVEARYDSFEDGLEALDRDRVLEEVVLLLSHVRELIKE